MFACKQRSRTVAGRYRPTSDVLDQAQVVSGISRRPAKGQCADDLLTPMDSDE